MVLASRSSVSGIALVLLSVWLLPLFEKAVALPTRNLAEPLNSYEIDVVIDEYQVLETQEEDTRYPQLKVIQHVVVTRIETLVEISSPSAQDTAHSAVRKPCKKAQLLQSRDQEQGEHKRHKRQMPTSEQGATTLMTTSTTVGKKQTSLSGKSTTTWPEEAGTTGADGGETTSTPTGKKGTTTGKVTQITSGDSQGTSVPDSSMGYSSGITTGGDDGSGPTTTPASGMDYSSGYTPVGDDQPSPTPTGSDQHQFCMQPENRNKPECKDHKDKNEKPPCDKGKGWGPHRGAYSRPSGDKLSYKFGPSGGKPTPTGHGGHGTESPQPTMGIETSGGGQYTTGITTGGSMASGSPKTTKPAKTTTAEPAEET